MQILQSTCCKTSAYKLSTDTCVIRCSCLGSMHGMRVCVCVSVYVCVCVCVYCKQSSLNPSMPSAEYQTTSSYVQ